MKQSAASLALDTIPSPYTAYIGVDWAECKHDVCLYDPTAQHFEFSVIGSQPEAIDVWVEGLRKRFSGRTIAVCTEQKRHIVRPLCIALH
jgi:hypothetical protein